MCSSVSLRVLITLFCTVYFCFGVVYGFLGWYVPYLLILSIGSIIGGVILTAAHIVDALSSIIGGILADMFSRRLITGVSALLYLSACLLLVIGVIARDPLFLAMSVIAAELTAIKGPALGALLADNVPREVIGRISSICSLAMLVGSAIGASLLVYTFKLNIEMFLLTITTLCLLPVPLLIMLREHRPSRRDSGASVLSRVRAVLKSGSEFWRVNRRLAYLTLVNAIGHGLAGEYLAPYLTQVKHISDIELGLRFTITILGQGAVRYLVGYLLDKRLELAIPLIRLGTVLIGILWLLLVHAPGPLALILYIISGILTSLFTGSAIIYLLKTSKPEARSTVLGTFQSMFNTVYTIAITPGGILYQADRDLAIAVAAIILTLTPLKP